MDEFFFQATEHQALAEPMVLECACSAPVRDNRRRAAPRDLSVFIARTSFIESFVRWLTPLRTAPPFLSHP